MARLAKLSLLSLVLIAVPTLLPAQSSVDTPNSDTTCGPATNVPIGPLPAGPKLGLTLKIENPAGILLPIVKVPAPEIDLVACQTGEDVSVNVANEACLQAVAKGYACTNLLVGGDPCCAAVFDPPTGPGGAGVTWALRKAAGATACGFRIDRDVGTQAVRFEADPFPAGTICRPVAQHLTTNSGNEVGPDLRPRVRVQVAPNGVHGIVRFNVFHTQVPPNPRTFTVDTSLFGGNEPALANAIKAGYDGTGLGLISRVHPRPDRSNTHLTEEFVSICPLVEIVNADTVTRFTAKGVKGQIIVIETGTDPKAVPSLSPWGVAFLIAVLLLTSVWMLRRRVRHLET